ncbi:DsbA family protein [Corynebacterium pilosum]|uniref:Putative secreted protein n=1 Tax=Corynebacterium pilosum TaxID=35756 RepID=A0A376CJZ0_9CORY|nr:thioredoxin domain-containing protein [Corynebacterium pilosum]STC68744.1 putative secreted protein [Corynebacterium pilosum]
MSTKKVQNPNQSSNTGFIWAIIAVVVIAAIVIGFIVFNGRSQKAAELAENMVPVEGVEMDYNKDEGTIVLSAAEGGEEAPHAELFEDFSCDYCAQLAENTDQQMLDEIQAGDLEVAIRSLNFLDRGEEGNSTNVLAAVLATVNSGDVELYWNFRKTMMDQQQQIYNQWSNDQFADLAESYGADSETVDAIRNGEYLEEAKSVAQSNADYLNEQTGNVSSPRVLVDGQDAEGEDINNWVSEVAL